MSNSSPGLVQGFLNLEPKVVYGRYAYYYGWIQSYDLSGTNIDCFSSLGKGDSYSPSFALSAANTSTNGYACRGPASIGEAGQELQFPSVDTAGVRIRRDVYVDPDGRFARSYDEFENTSNVPISYEVQVSVQAATYYTQLTETVALSAVQGRYLAVGLSGLGLAASSVFCSASPTANCPTAAADSSILNGLVPLTWTIIIPAGEKRALVNYVVLRDSSNASEVVPMSDALVAGSAANMFVGLSSEERARVVNFVATP